MAKNTSKDTGGGAVGRTTLMDRAKVWGFFSHFNSARGHILQIAFVVFLC